jgi:Predicted O-methyltransferase
VTTRHEFLAMLHANLKPRGYLEIGVLFGDSLRLAQCPAIGIDPDPRIRYHLSSQVYATTSDDFFSVDHTRELLTFDIDLAFIDGEHLYEYALRDFMNIERYSNPRTVIVFDDVLPRNQAEAAREQCPGDWTGDVWKVPQLLRTYRPDLKILMVDTEPTGTCVVFGLNAESKKLHNMYNIIMNLHLDEVQEVPEEVLSREHAIGAEHALEQVLVSLQELSA